MNWKRLKKFLSVGKNGGKSARTHLISVLPHVSDTAVIRDHLRLPLRLVGAHVSEITAGTVPPTVSVRKRFMIQVQAWYFTFRTSFFWFCLKYYGQKMVSVLTGVLIACFLVEGVIGLIIWRMPPDRFHRFTACLDSGVVPSWWERIVYHTACFWGSIS